MFFIKVYFYKILMMGLKWAVALIPQPQPVIFTGKDSSLALIDLIISQQVNRILLVTDNVLNKLGIADKICHKLAEHNIEIIIFDQVTPDPNEQVVERGIQAAKNGNCQLVLGIGGGSSLDAAKMIAVLSTSEKSVKDVAGLLKIKQRGLPLYLLPTTSGTGSEVTMAAVITDSQHTSKSLVISPKMMPIATALDPLLMQGMPAKITADTGFDALTHALEAFLSTHANQQTNLYALTAIKLIFKQLPVAYQDGKNIAAREALAIASCYAGLAFTKAGLGYVHAISHQIGAKYHLPHGMTNAIVLPHVLRFNLKSSTSRLAKLALEIGLETNNLSELELATNFIDAVIELQGELAIATNIPQLQKEDVKTLAKAALKEAHYLYPVPQYLNLAQCQQLISQLFPV
ncbi:iron-containing alcohol dehydrogenase [Pseudoalteromonas tetraodonis]|uniref:iron-containing alcohol dehydrogenase n=1 Tax=Pseudoalteromonas tetraodonis TaxID=43659 RepID=UPI003A96FAC0